MINLGIIGLGHIATHQMAAIELSQQFRLAAGCDPDTSRHELLDRTVAPYEDSTEFLEHPGLEVVVVASPNRLHVEHGLQVIRSGKWLCMEKPLAETQDEFDRFAVAKDEFSGYCTLALHAAFGVELDWFCRNVNEHGFDIRKMSSFEASFYDPYVENGQLLPQAKSLGGSWMDSGLNALSVLGRLIDPEALTITRSLMTRDDRVDCLELAGQVEFEFARPDGQGVGAIGTSWIEGLNKKVTTLEFADCRSRVILDHSEQQITVHDNGSQRQIFTSGNGLPRLTNHYVGVFADLASQIESRQDNFDYCARLHRFLFQGETLAG
jgi:D-galactose 1-dehydrogenase